MTPGKSLLNLFEAKVFNYIIGNAAHGKNFQYCTRQDKGNRRPYTTY